MGTPNQTGQTGQADQTGQWSAPCTYCHQPAGQPCRQARHRWYGDLDHARVRATPHAARLQLVATGWTVQMHDGYPVAEPIEVTVSRSVRVRCPLCARVHTHGWAEDMRNTYSHRVSHCHLGDGYFIAPTGDLA